MRGMAAGIAPTTGSWSWSEPCRIPAAALVYTSDAALRARMHALGAKVAGARALLDEIAAVRDPAGPNVGSVESDPNDTCGT